MEVSEAEDKCNRITKQQELDIIYSTHHIFRSTNLVALSFSGMEFLSSIIHHKSKWYQRMICKVYETHKDDENSYVRIIIEFEVTFTHRILYSNRYNHYNPFK